MKQKMMLVAFAVFVWTTPAWAATVTFQEGLAGYASTVDTHLSAQFPAIPPPDPSVVIVDGAGPGFREDGLLRFDNIFGALPNQIPLGSTINSATLTVNVVISPGTNTNMHRMLQTWDEIVTFNGNFGGNGIDANGVEAATAALFISSLPLGSLTLDVASFVQDWSDGAANFGWVFLASTQDGWQFTSSEGTVIGDRPKLTVTFVPEPSTFILAALVLLALGRSKCSTL